MQNQMTSQRLTKGLNELANMFVTFMVSIWKITGLSLFSRCKKNLPLRLIMAVLLKNYINKLKHLFFLYLAPPEIVN